MWIGVMEGEIFESYMAMSFVNLQSMKFWVENSQCEFSL